MEHTPKLIVMLTHRDKTVADAYAIFDQCKDTQAAFWGMKEAPLPVGEMKRLFAYMKSCGKRTALEVVAYTQEACLAGARLAAECGCDLLMGTKFFSSVRDICRANGLKYLPFVGEITGRPSVLRGSLEAMIAEGRRCLEEGAYGIDLLGYRYPGDTAALNRAFVSQIQAPVCIAGSVDSYQRLDELKEASPWAFTIGSAFFQGKFGGTFPEQIDRVCDYMRR